MRMMYSLWACVLMLSCRNESDDALMVFRFNQPEGISTLDPAFSKNQPVIWASHLLYNSLVEIDDSLHIRPSLAKRWEISPDGRTYTFYLRDSIYFHDNPAFPGGKGRKLVAADVVFSFNRIIDKATASPGAWIFNGKVDTLRPFTTVGDSIFQLHLLRPFPPVMGILGMQYCSVVPREVVQKYGKDFRRNPCGTGPFVMHAWEEGQALILHRNDHYFERDSAGHSLPYLDAVKITFLDSKAAEFLEFRQGRLDFINDIDANFKDEVLTKKGELKQEWNGKINLLKHPYLNTEYLGILFDSTNELVQQSPLRQLKIRQAMNYAIDRPKMMMYLRNSIGTPALSGFIPAGFPSFNADIVKGYPYDPGKARALLKEAGYGPGKSMPVVTLKTIPIYAELGAYVAWQLEQVGIQIQVETVQRATLLEEIVRSKVMFFRANWGADYPDAENYLGLFYSKNPAPPNYTRYNNQEFDKLYEKALTITNDSSRYDLYRKMDQMVMRDAPVIPLWYDMAIHLVNPRVSGFHPNALNLLELRKTRISNSANRQ